MDCEHRRTAVKPLPTRTPNAAAGPAGVESATAEEMSYASRSYRNTDEYLELLERTRAGLNALDVHTTPPYEVTREDCERLQREVDGVIARWKAEHPGTRRAC